MGNLGGKKKAAGGGPVTNSAAQRYMSEPARRSSTDELPPATPDHDGGRGETKDEYANLESFDRDYSRGPKVRKAARSPAMDPQLQSFADSLKKKEGGGKRGKRSAGRPAKHKHIIMGNVQQLPGTLRDSAGVGASPDSSRLDSARSSGMVDDSMEAALAQPAVQGFALGNRGNMYRKPGA